MKHFVIDRPESVEVKHLFIPSSSSFHFSIWLISDTMINEFKPWSFNYIVINFFKVMNGKVREEVSFIVFSLDECMSSVTISLDCRHDNKTIFIFKFSWLHNTFSTSFDCSFKNTSSIFNSESNIFNSVTMSGEVGIEFIMAGWV